MFFIFKATDYKSHYAFIFALFTDDNVIVYASTAFV